MKIDIDTASGFCFGVVYAIEKAEEELRGNKKLYCLGDIVHNNMEVERLKNLGLITIDHDKFKKLKNCKVLLRAHGEPPETYKIALKNNIELIDASCPVVLKLQKNIKAGFDKMEKLSGQVVIFGKKNHAEVNGLVGQTRHKAIVVSNWGDIDKIDYKKPICIFSQTTKKPTDYKKIIEEIKKRMTKGVGKQQIEFVTHDTICRQVSNRDNELREFARKHDIIIFVSGKKSSNGRMLYDICLEENKNAHFISSTEEIQQKWFQDDDYVGVCGANSTPRWLMEKVADKIRLFS